MIPKQYRLFLLLFIALVTVNRIGFTQTNELSINEVVSLGLANDPELAVAIATKDMDVEAKWQGIANVLPNLSASYQKNPNAKTISQLTGATTTNNSTVSRYDSASTIVQLKQPLFRPRQFLGLIQGFDKEILAEYELKTATHNSVMRSISAYNNWLVTESMLKFGQVSLIAAESQEQKLHKMREKGLASEVDLSQAVTEKHRAKMDLASANQQFEFARQTFFGLINQRNVKPRHLSGTPNPNTLKITSTFDDLLLKAHTNNLEIRASEKALEIAQLEYKKSLADHAPTVDLVATYSDSDNFNDVAVGRRTKTNSVGILVNVPIFSGGATLSANRQSAANLKKAQAELLQIKNKITSDFYKAYEALQTAQEKWQHANAAYEAASLGLKSSVKQFKSGLKSKVDVDFSEQNLAQANLDITKAKTEWIMAKAQLLYLTGELETIIGSEYTSLFSGKL